MLRGWFGEVQIPSQFMTGDAATTADQLRHNEGLFRLGFAAYLVEAFSDLVLAWLFYVLLKPVDRDLALLSAFFGLVSMSSFAVMKMFYFSAPVFLESKYLTGFSPSSMTDSRRILVALRLEDCSCVLRHAGSFALLTFNPLPAPSWGLMVARWRIFCQEHDEGAFPAYSLTSCCSLFLSGGAIHRIS